MRTLLISSIALCVSLVAPARADVVLTAEPFIGFDAGWSFDGGTIRMADGFTGTITSGNVATAIVAFDLSFTSPVDSYTISSALGDTVFMPSASMANFDGIQLTIPTTDPLASAIFFSRVTGIDSQQIVFNGARTDPPVIARQTLTDSLATPDFSQSSPAVSPLVVASVPEPSAFLCIGLVGVGAMGLRRLSRIPCTRES